MNSKPVIRWLNVFIDRVFMVNIFVVTLSLSKGFDRLSLTLINTLYLLHCFYRLLFYRMTGSE